MEVQAGFDEPAARAARPRSAARQRKAAVGEFAARPARPPELDLSGPHDRQLVADALRALLRERSAALQLATRIAVEHRRAPPDPRDFGLVDILRLSRLVER